MADTRLSMDVVTNGRINGPKALVVLVLLVLFVLWRLSATGVANPERVLARVEEELTDEYREALYDEYGLYDEEVGARAEGFPVEMLEDLTVTFDNVSMSAPLLSWASTEDVVVRFDYALEAGGEVRERGERLYRLVPGTGFTVWDSGPVGYWLNYLF